MSRSKRRLIIGGLVLASAVGYLAVTGVRSGWVYYLNVDEFVQQEELSTRRARVHGTVSPDGLDARPAELYARFDLRGELATLPVLYRGPIPDLFAAEREVVIEGAMGDDGVFAADVLMTKCASKYESAAHIAAEARQ